MSDVVQQFPLVPLPIVRLAAGRRWSQIYHDADQGHLGPITRVGSRLYVDRRAALTYVERHRPAEGAAAIAQLLQPATVAESGA